MDPIKAKIQELVPDVKGICASHDYHHDDCGPCAFSERSITLAVVLRAIEKTNNRNEIVVYTDGDFGEWDSDGRFTSAYVKWNLEHDNYDAQSQETKDFIGSLLGV